MQRTRTIALLAVLAGLGGLSACGDPAGLGQAQDDVAALRVQVRDLEARLDDVEGDLATEKRRNVSRVRDLEQATRSRVAAAASSPAARTAGEPNGAAAAPGDDEERTVTAGEFTEFLSTSAGQDVFTAAMRSYQQKQSDDRQRRVVDALVEPFAKKAQLSDRQKEQLSDVLLNASTQVRDTWASMRDVAPEQRGTQVAANIQRSQEIRRESDEAVGEFLSATQYTLYEEEAGTLYGMPQRRPGGDGGGAGRR